MNLYQMRLATLLSVALAAAAMNSVFAGGGDGKQKDDGCCKQKDDGCKQKDNGCCKQKCSDGKGPCPRGKGLTTCCCEEPAPCRLECGTKERDKTCFKVDCATICIPTMPCLRDPTCGCGKKGCGSCSDKCGSKDDGKDGGKGCDRCGGGCGLFGGGLVLGCCECRGRIKKRLYMKDVTVGKIPVRKCVVDKGAEDKGTKGGKGAKVNVNDDEVPAPPVAEARLLYGKPVVEMAIYK
jgi:hypothetical protein